MNVFKTLDAKVTPVTAYQFIRNCGNRMVAETADSRISLVMEIWEKLRSKGTFVSCIHVKHDKI